MFKKLCLSLTFAALSASSAQCSDGTTAPSDLIDHMDQQKRAIVLEIKKIMIVSEKAIPHMKTLLGDKYEQLTSEITAVVNNIITSEEFNVSINHFTDYQLNHIVEKGLCYNDIGYPEIAYPIFKKIDDELTKAFPSLDQQTEQLFNIFYVTIANYRGGKLLLEKLALKEAELQQELLALEASDHAISE
jgi:hypothetical protein